MLALVLNDQAEIDDGASRAPSENDKMATNFRTNSITLTELPPFSTTVMNSSSLTANLKF